MAIITNKKINNNRAFICIKQNGKLKLAPVRVFGTTRVVAGKRQLADKIAQSIYDLRQQSHKFSFCLELCNGGTYDEELQGYKNWFPGARTFGFLRWIDAPLVDENKEQMYDEHNNAIYVPMYGGPITVNEAMVEILDHLDAAMIDENLKVRWNLYYKVRTSTGIVGYISALAISDVIYRI